MKRLGRIILNGLTALSLLMCVATVGLWVRSYHAWDMVEWSGRRLQTVRSASGGLLIDSTAMFYRRGHLFGSNGREWIFDPDVFVAYPNLRGSDAKVGADQPRRYSWRTYRPNDLGAFLRNDAHFDTDRLIWPVIASTDSCGEIETSGDGIQDARIKEVWMRGRFVVLPFWLLGASEAVLPLWWLRGRLMTYWRTRRKYGHCTSCHYNLTGNVSGVCPECGIAIVRAG